MTSPDIHTLIGPYALDALSDVERRDFENHLADCEACAQELTGLRETATRLALAAAQVPPPGLHDQVMGQITRVRRLPPRVGARPAARRRLPAAIAAAAAVLLVAVTLGVVTHRSAHQSEAQRIQAVLAAPDAARATGPVATGGTGTVVSSRSLNQAVIIMTRLSQLPAARSYQLWFMGSQPPRSIGIMHNRDGTVLATRLSGITQVGLTIEPAHGSPTPTSPPIFTIKLPA